MRRFVYWRGVVLVLFVGFFCWWGVACQGVSTPPDGSDAGTTQDATAKDDAKGSQDTNADENDTTKDVALERTAIEAKEEPQVSDTPTDAGTLDAGMRDQGSSSNDKEGALCNANTDCLQGFICFHFGGQGACLKRCSNDAGCQHRQGLSCVQTNQNTGVCLQTRCTYDGQCSFSAAPFMCTNQLQVNVCVPFPKGERGLGEKCDRSGGAAQLCKPPFHCINLQGQTGFCAPGCEQHADCQKHDPAAQCLLGADRGIKLCAFPCQNNGQCSKYGMTCTSQGICGH